MVFFGLVALLPRSQLAALRRVYGGSRWMTCLKLTGLLATYLVVFAGSLAMLVLGTLWLF